MPDQPHDSDASFTDEEDNNTDEQSPQKVDDDDDRWEQIVSSEPILEAIQSMGFSAPTPIQKAVIPQAISLKKDVIGAAETGSGKTLAFAIPILQRWLTEGRQNLARDEVKLFAFVIAPTRELAIQIVSVFKQLTAKTGPRPMHTVAIVGGISEQKQQRQLRARPDIVVATPGRLWALKQTGDEHLEDLSALRVLVVDEIDRMLEQGHFEELKHIVNDIHRNRKDQLLTEEHREQLAGFPQLQTLIFSATLTFTHHIPVKKGEKAATTNLQSVDPKQKVRRIAQSMCMRKGASKLAVVDLTLKQKLPKTLVECRMNCMDLLQKDTNLYYLLRRYGGRTLVFGNSVSAIRRLQGLLRKLELPGGTRILHGRMKEKERLRSVERFEASTNAILLATDVAARGLDFQSVQNIVHYQAPKTTENYIHRSGRTARASRAGLSVLFVDPLDLHSYQKICRNMDRDRDLEVLAVDNEALMANCRELVELATEAESLEHRVQKKRAREQWFERAAREADLIWEDEDGEEDGGTGGRKRKKKNKKKATAKDGMDEGDEPGVLEQMSRRRKAVEHRLKQCLRASRHAGGGADANDNDNDDAPTLKTTTTSDVPKKMADSGVDQVRKRLRLERGAKKWFKRPKTTQQ